MSQDQVVSPKHDVSFGRGGIQSGSRLGWVMPKKAIAVDVVFCRRNAGFRA